MISLRVPVLMFHHVEAVAAAELVPPPLFPNSYLARRELAAILDALAVRGYRTLTLAEAAARRRAGRRLPRRAVVLTFDDGCRCFRDHAAPELAARGMTATLFAVSGELGGSNRWDRPEGETAGAGVAGRAEPAERAGSAEPAGWAGPAGSARPAAAHGSARALASAGAPGERREELLGAAALRELAAAGFEVGSHGRRHRDLMACDAAVLAEEVAGSREELAAALGAMVHTFCYPYGRLDERARAAVAGAGYAAAAAIHGAARLARFGDPFAVPRFAVNPGDSRFELLLKASGAYRWWSRMPRLGVLRGLRTGGGAPGGTGGERRGRGGAAVTSEAPPRQAVTRRGLRTGGGAPGGGDGAKRGVGGVAVARDASSEGLAEAPASGAAREAGQ